MTEQSITLIVSAVSGLVQLGVGIAVIRYFIHRKRSREALSRYHIEGSDSLDISLLARVARRTENLLFMRRALGRHTWVLPVAVIGTAASQQYGWSAAAAVFSLFWFWSAGALSRFSQGLAWGIVAVWALGELALLSMMIFAGDDMPPVGQLPMLIILCVVLTLALAPLLLWARGVLLLWNSDRPVAQAFRQSRAWLDTPAMNAARQQREKQRWSGKKGGGSAAALQGAALVQELLGAFSGVNIVDQTMRQLGAETRGLASQLSAVTGSELLSTAGDRPIVYLRSFKDDPLSFSTWTRGRIPWEKPVVDAGFQVAPVVAIGKPGEARPSLGAARDYVADEEWREHAHQWMDAAEAIILTVGETEGVGWEAVNLAKLHWLRKTVLVVPPLPEPALHQRWTKFHDNVQRSGAFEVTQHLNPRMTLAIIFPDGMRPVSLISSCSSKPSDYYWATVIALTQIVRGTVVS